MKAGGRDGLVLDLLADDEEVASQRGVTAAESMLPPQSPVHWEEIPATLRAADRWVVWEAVWQHDPNDTQSNRWSQVHYCATSSGVQASPGDARTWSSFDSAVEALQANPERFAGLAFLLSHHDTIAVIEIEDAITDSGALSPEIAKVLARLNSYAEVTPSGRGVRVFVEAHLPPGGRRRDRFGFCETDRFVCVTGHRLRGMPSNVVSRQSAIEELHAELFPPPPPRPVGMRNISPATDRELLELALDGANGVRVRALYHGELGKTAMDRDGADLALCSLLGFYTGDDPARLDRLFRNSRLYRRKWDEPHYIDGRTYGQAVVAKALEGCLVFYTAPVNSHLSASEVPTAKSLPRLPAVIENAANSATTTNAEDPAVVLAASSNPAPQYVPVPVVPSVLDGMVNPLAIAEAQGRAHGLAMSEKVLTAREAAEFLHISTRMLRRCVRPWKRFGDSPSGDRWLLSDLLHRLEG